MKLGIDAREIQDGVFTGIGGPLADFLNYFSKQDNDDTCILFSEKTVPIDFGPKVRNVVLDKSITFYWDQVILPKAIKQEKIDLFYSPYYKIPFFKSCKTISAILDLMYLQYEEYSKKINPLARLYYFTFGRMLAQRADSILTCSEYSKKDVVDLYKVKADKIKVIPLSISDVFSPETDEKIITEAKQKFGIDSPYILYVGNFKPHKNVKRIIRAFKNLTKEFRELKLVLAGPKEYMYSELNTLVKEFSLKNKVIFTGKIMDKKTQKSLYCAAEVFIMPSFYEGFGLPPVEAMACGTAVVASNCTSIPEVVKDAGLLVDPYHINEMTEAIRRLLKDKLFGDELREKGFKYVTEYSKDKICRRTYDFFNKVFLA